MSAKIIDETQYKKAKEILEKVAKLPPDIKTWGSKIRQEILSLCFNWFGSYVLYVTYIIKQVPIMQKISLIILNLLLMLV